METENEDTTPELDLQDIVNTLFQTEPSQGKTNVISTSERFRFNPPFYTEGNACN